MDTKYCTEPVTDNLSTDIYIQLTTTDSVPKNDYVFNELSMKYYPRTARICVVKAATRHSAQYVTTAVV